jgi:hypothetical protein
MIDKAAAKKANMSQTISRNYYLQYLNNRKHDSLGSDLITMNK